MSKKNVLIVVSAVIVLIVVIGLALALLLPSRSMAANLTINGEFKNARSVVYEIPDDEGRADVVRSIEAIRDRFFHGLELIDATKLDDSALKAKLKEDFVLYTTLGEKSRLFKAATQPLHIQIDGSTLRWDKLALPLSDLRIILIGRNPYGDGRCVIYAAGTNQLLKDVNNVSHGPCSYHIFRGDKLLKEGFYNEQFIEKSRISQAEAIDDVHQFFSTMQRVHPDLLAKVDFKEYIKLKQQTLDGIAKKLDKDGKISVDELAYLLYYAAAYFQDGHTSVQWQMQPNESNTQGKQFPPFRLNCENGRFVVAAAKNKSIEGSEIISIDGKPVREFLKPILDRCSGETLAFKAVRFTSKQSFWYSFTNLLASTESLKLRLRDARGKESAQSVETVSFADFQKLKDNMLERLRQRVKQGPQVHFLDSGRIAHFIYPAFIWNEDEKKKINGVFEEIKAKKTQELIIDIRANGGGTSNMGDFIFSYLYGKKFCPFSKIRVKLSRDVLSSVAKDWEIPEEAELDGVIVNWQIGDQSSPKPPAFFSGRVFLLVDNGTFSAAADFATMFRDYGVGKILGYETGGIPNCFGDVYSFNLTNSGIGCGVSWKQFFGPKPRLGDDEHGILPDIPASSEMLRAYHNEEDPVLALTLDHVKKTRKSH